MTDFSRPPGRPRTPEGDLDERQRAKRQRWRALSAARYEALRPQREAERLRREALRAERATRPQPGTTPRRNRKTTETRPQGIPSGDRRPW